MKWPVSAGVGLTIMLLTVGMTGLAGAHGGDPAKVHACVTPGSGSIRVIAPTESCRNNESPLDWSLTSGTTYSAGFGLALNGNEFSVIGAPWGGLTGVPAELADGDDNGSSLVAQLRNDLATAGSGIVIDGGSIRSGTITATALAGSDDPAQRVLGAVTSEKVLDGTIQARDLATSSVDATKIGSGQVGNDELAAGAVTTAKQTANTVSATDGVGAPSSTPSSPGGETLVPLFGATLTVPPGSNSHQVLVTANAAVTCTTGCDPSGTGSNITYQLGEMVGSGPATFVPLSPEYSAPLTWADVTENISISGMHTASPGPHIYMLRITHTNSGTVSRLVLNAVDLGRLP